ncbi:hypothetical protein M0804_010345 [Polistes exclamans]|nr:hypothetical protein M0804_010345 [Polistes exclamans]
MKKRELREDNGVAVMIIVMVVGGSMIQVILTIGWFSNDDEATGRRYSGSKYVLLGRSRVTSIRFPVTAVLHPKLPERHVRVFGVMVISCLRDHRVTGILTYLHQEFR